MRARVASAMCSARSSPGQIRNAAASTISSTEETAGASRGPLAAQPSPTPSDATKAIDAGRQQHAAEGAGADHFADPEVRTTACTRFCSHATKSSSSAPVLTNGVQS